MRESVTQRRAVFLGVTLLIALASGLTWGIEPQEQGSYLSSKSYFEPDLYISSSNERLEAILDELPNKAAWQSALIEAKASDKAAPVVFIDPRSGTASSIIESVPLLPGTGIGNKITVADVYARLGRETAKDLDDEVGPDEVLALVRQYVRQHSDILGVNDDQVGNGRAGNDSPALWHVSIPQTYQGVPVRHGRIAATINNGNLVLIGTETWGNVRGLSTKPRVSRSKAIEAGFEYAGGRSALDIITREPALEIIPMAGTGGIGQGYRHALTWTFEFTRQGEVENWEVIVHAMSGQVMSFEDTNHYADGQISGGVYPITSTEVCPTPGTCGTMQDDYPMPFADTGLPAPNNFTNSAGVFNGTGTVTTTFTGRFVDINDSCGAISVSGTNGLDLGGVNGQHDCTTSTGPDGGTNASSRTAFYELNKLIEQARGWLPGNTFLQGQIDTNLNLGQTCNAFYSPGNQSVNFYRSGGGCRNTGELAGVFDHEWGHALDDNDTAGAFSNSSEAYADIANLYRLHDSCVGHGFFETVNDGCGTTSDGTGFNVNEAQIGASYCATDCSGVRDADFARHTPPTPVTPLNFVCGQCLNSSGPCGRQVHCAAAPSRQAAWDFVARDLQAAPFNLDRQSAFVLGNKIYYQGSGNIGLWHSCACGSSSDGCGAGSAYLQWLAADDDNGNLNDGTPHMTALFDAFDRHEIACSSPTPQNSGCAGAPTTAPTLTATGGDGEVSLSWNNVPNASEFFVFRTEGHAGCDFGKVKLAEVTGTSFTDTEVAPGREYFYSVAAAGTNDACFTRLSNCDPATPNAPPPPPPPPPPPTCNTEIHGCDFESGQCGWTVSGSTCATGDFEVGTPDQVINGGVTTQVGGAATGTGAFFTEPNTGGAGTNDVDGGTCVAVSPVLNVSAGDIAVFTDFFHGQRDAGDDATDGFVIDLLNNGAVVDTVVSFGDVTNNAVWTAATSSAAVSSGTVQLRLRATDGPAAGDLVEAGIDNVRICTDGDPPPPPPPPPPCTVDDDFESGTAGWVNNAASTCATGAYVEGTPTEVINGGVTTQVGGANSGTTAIFTAVNTAAGTNDVDGGNCILSSPTFSVADASTLSVAFFHGQRDAGDDAAGDFFALEFSTDGGTTFSTLASNGDSTSNAAWATATAPIPANSDVQIRVQCSDGAGPGDLVECGIDDVSICSN